jgi:hypothetical protein
MAMGAGVAVIVGSFTGWEAARTGMINDVLRARSSPSGMANAAIFTV